MTGNLINRVVMKTSTPNHTPALMPTAGSLRAGPAPYTHSHASLTPMTTPFIVAGLILILPGLVLFGWAAARTIALAVLAALATEVLLRALSPDRPHRPLGQALLTGVLLACTLPPGLADSIVIAGSIGTLLLAHLVLGGIGHYNWHPVALGRVAMQVLFHDQLSPERWPVLAPGFKETLRPGMTVAVEPKFFPPGKGGVGLENTWLVTDRGAERITDFPDDLVIC